MAHIAIEQHGIDAIFGTEQGGMPSITLSDPSYARAEKILFDPRTGCVHAVLHEGLFMIGHVPDGMAKAFSEQNHIELRTDDNGASCIRLRAPLSVVTLH